MAKKLLIWSDAPDGVTGLGRICRELTQHLVDDPETREMFDIATLGYNAQPTRRFDWFQYSHANQKPGVDWLRAVEDISSGDEVIVLPIMPVSWLLDFMSPDLLPLPTGDPFKRRLIDLNTKLRWWPYVAVESCTRQDRFNATDAHTLRKAERRLWYSEWGQRVGKNTGLEGDFCYHGVYTDVFSRFLNTRLPGLKRKIGCIMTNQWRKRWGLIFEIMGQFSMDSFEFTAITDTPIGYWNLMELANMYKVKCDLKLSTKEVTDDMLALWYSECDMVVLPSYGEGFGYPVVEAQAAGAPCIVGRFGAQSELVDPRYVVEPEGFEIDGIQCGMKPWYNPEEWIKAMCKVLKTPPDRQELSIKVKTKFDWSSQWPKFKEWLLKGV